MTLLVWRTSPKPAVSQSRRISSSSSSVSISCGPAAVASRSCSSAVVGRPQSQHRRCAGGPPGRRTLSVAELRALFRGCLAGSGGRRCRRSFPLSIGRRGMVCGRSPGSPGAPGSLTKISRYASICRVTLGDLRDHIPGYRLIEPVGQGGFAVVYRALHERVGRVVAVKILSVADLDERALRNFRRELEVMGRLSGHPNIVAALDTGTTPTGRPYIVMDFHEGGSLHTQLRAAGALPANEVLRIGVKVAAALAAVHDAGVFHGDIKPQNILVSKYGEPALADFGVARMLDVGQLSSNTLIFTPHHAAPEVLNGLPQNVVSDVYALGSTLYQLLAGRPAYYDAADVGVAPLLLRVLRQPLPPLPEPGVPAPLRALVERAMSKEPDARPQNAWAFVEELQKVQRALGLPVTEPATAIPAPLPAAVTPPHRQRPLPFALGLP
ncbi:serine/threonine-protein kinase [Nonomuraea recticatena]|uniref:serine/threonine-protein kinase n=1 Tax=Nonomuraea recticatena TaxID=46178 RepID=UPI00360D120A